VTGEPLDEIKTLTGSVLERFLLAAVVEWLNVWKSRGGLRAISHICVSATTEPARHTANVDS
jgi:hypothetical protein